MGGLEEEENNSVTVLDGGLGDDDTHEYHLFEKDEVYSFVTIFWI